MRDAKARQAFLRKELAMDSVMSNRCPICREKTPRDLLTRHRPDGTYLVTDCHGYGGLYRLVRKPTCPSYFRQLMTWDEWTRLNG